MKYDRCHDGPVSERLWALRRVKFLKRKVAAFPADSSLRKRLALARGQLKSISRVQAARSLKPGSGQRNKGSGNGGASESRGKQPDSPDTAGSLIRVQSGPSNGTGDVQEQGKPNGGNALGPFADGRGAGVTPGVNKAFQSPVDCNFQSLTDTQTVSLELGTLRPNDG